MQTLSNGVLLSQKPLDAGMREDHWRMDQSVQVYAIMFAIGRFAIAKDSWRDPQGNLRDVHYYTEPAYAPYAHRDVQKHAGDDGFLLPGPPVCLIPWNKYNQVVVRDYVSGAMENTTASLFGEWMNQDSRQLLDASTDDVVAHELFHQWFGDYVTAESWSNLTLSESFATYSTQLWRRYKNGPASADEQAFEDLQRYLGAAEQSDPPLVRLYYQDKEDMFDRISYQKGACILRYINSITGDSLFNRAMEIYLKRNALRSAEASQWRLALEESTGRDWTQFFRSMVSTRRASSAAHSLQLR
jgi:aminopeptidase N